MNATYVRVDVAQYCRYDVLTTRKTDQVANKRCRGQLSPEFTY